MNGLDAVIEQLQGVNSDLEQSNDAAEMRDFLRKYPWLSESDYKRHKAIEAAIHDHYSKPAAELNLELVAAHDETVSHGWSAE